MDRCSQEARMDLAALTAFLAPLLPVLLRVGGRVADTATDAAAEQAVGFAKRIWNALRGPVQEKDAAREAVEDLSRHPNDEELRTVLRVQLRKLLEQDAELAAEVGRLWEEAEAAGATAVSIRVTASGTGSVAIGRDAIGSSIVTGAQPEDASG
jgi:hypothetical protein